MIDDIFISNHLTTYHGTDWPKQSGESVNNWK